MNILCSMSAYCFDDFPHELKRIMHRENPSQAKVHMRGQIWEHILKFLKWDLNVMVRFPMTLYIFNDTFAKRSERKSSIARWQYACKNCKAREWWLEKYGCCLWEGCIRNRIWRTNHFERRCNSHFRKVKLPLLACLLIIGMVHSHLMLKSGFDTT